MKASDITSHPDYKQYLAGVDKFQEREGVDYAWVREFAKTELERTRTIVTLIETKADWLSKFLGTGSTFLALLAYVGQDFAAGFSAAYLAPAVILLLAAFILMIYVKTPVPMTEPPTTLDAVTYAEEFSETDFALMCGLASEGLRLVINRKARKLMVAQVCLAASVAWLIGAALYHSGSG